jgi:hypothetical protein
MNAQLEMWMAIGVMSCIILGFLWICGWFWVSTAKQSIDECPTCGYVSPNSNVCQECGRGLNNS